jgi:hypothetical protein
LGRLDSDFTPALRFEQALINAIQERFSREQWFVREQPLIGFSQPDMLLQSPHQRNFLIEVKLTSGPLHFGTLAQLAQFRDIYKEANPGGNVYGVLVTNASVATTIVNAARELELDVVAASGPPSVVADALLERLRQLDQAA